MKPLSEALMDLAARVKRLEDSAVTVREQKSAALQARREQAEGAIDWGQVGNRGLVVICSIEELVGMHFLRRASRCRTFGPSVAEGGARCWTFLEKGPIPRWERDLVVKTGSDLDTIAGR